MPLASLRSKGAHPHVIPQRHHQNDDTPAFPAISGNQQVIPERSIIPRQISNQVAGLPTPPRYLKGTPRIRFINTSGVSTPSQTPERIPRIRFINRSGISTPRQTPERTLRIRFINRSGISTPPRINTRLIAHPPSGIGLRIPGRRLTPGMKLRFTIPEPYRINKSRQLRFRLKLEDRLPQAVMERIVSNLAARYPRKWGDFDPSEIDTLPTPQDHLRSPEIKAETE